MLLWLPDLIYTCILSCSAWFSDHSKGFGGKYGVQTDRVDKSAFGYDHHEKLEKHESQKGIV